MKELGKSFIYAWKGIVFCLHHERNMRIHFTVSVYMYAFLFVYDFFIVTRTQLAILLVTNAVVFMAEIINTAIENTINLLETKYNKFCEIAKDAAAGAVLVGAVFAVLIGIAILFQPEAFRQLFNYYIAKPYMLIILAASIALSCVYVFSGPYIVIGRFTKHRK